MLSKYFFAGASAAALIIEPNCENCEIECWKLSEKCERERARDIGVENIKFL